MCMFSLSRFLSTGFEVELFNTAKGPQNSTEGEEPTKPQGQRDEQAFKVSYACIMEAEKFAQVLRTYVYVCGITMRGPTLEKRQKDEQAFRDLKWSFSTEEWNRDKKMNKPLKSVMHASWKLTYVALPPSSLAGKFVRTYCSDHSHACRSLSLLQV